MHPAWEWGEGSEGKGRDQPGASPFGWTRALAPKAVQEASMGLSGLVPKEHIVASLQSFIRANDCCDAARYVTLGPGRKYFWQGCCNFEQFTK